MKNQRKIDLIVVHCSATRINQDFPVEACHKARGLDEKGKPADTRTPAQKASLEDLLYSLVLDYPDAEILGHRDLPWVRKSCPCFDVKEWLKEIDFHL